MPWLCMLFVDLSLCIYGHIPLSPPANVADVITPRHRYLQPSPGVTRGLPQITGCHTGYDWNKRCGNHRRATVEMPVIARSGANVRVFRGFITIRFAVGKPRQQPAISGQIAVSFRPPPRARAAARAETARAAWQPRCGYFRRHNPPLLQW